MKKQILFYCFLLFTTVFEASAIYFRHIGKSDGLPQVTIMSIYQDPLGRMWFGSYGGLSMYDGTQVTVYRDLQFNPVSQESIRLGNRIQYISGDSKENIYFRSDGTLINYNIRSQSFHRFSLPQVPYIDYVLYSHGHLYYTYKKTVYRLDPEQEESSVFLELEEKDLLIKKILIDSDGTYWLGTNKGVYSYIKHTGKVSQMLPDIDVLDIYEDTSGNYWIATSNHGLFCRDGNGDIKQYVYDPLSSNCISSNEVRCITEDLNGDLWVGTFTGLNHFSRDKAEFTLYHGDILPGSLLHSSVFSLCMDHQGTIWVGTYYGGVHYFNQQTNFFTFYSHDRNRDDCLSFSFIGNMVEDCDSNLWVCTEGGGLNFLDRKNRRFKHFLAEEEKSLLSNNLKSIWYDSAGNKLYIGTHRSGLTIYDIGQDRFVNYMTGNPEWGDKPGDVIHRLEIWDNKLILLTQRGLFKTGLDPIRIEPLWENTQYGYVNNFMIDSGNYIWLLQAKKIIKISLEDPSDKFSYSIYEKGLGEADISTVFEDNTGRIFVGTLGDGLYLYDEESDLFLPFTKESGLLLSNICYEIKQSRQGHIIVSGDLGLTFLDPDLKTSRKMNVSTTTTTSFGLNQGCGIYVCEDGEIFIGGINGMLSFYEKDFFYEKKEYDLYFSGLYIHDEYVVPGDPSHAISTSMPFSSEIVLDHSQNNLRIAFAANDYADQIEKPSYAYRLEGLDKKWYYTNDKQLSYTNLNPGRYTLYVKDVKESPAPGEHMIQMNIKIRAPWYRSGLAYSTYTLIICLLLYLFYFFKRKQLFLESSLEMERKEKIRIEEVNQYKIHFFSNISHEFRTPLTLIISQLEVLLGKKQLPPLLYNKLYKVYRQANYLRDLINELLYFRRIEEGHTRLQVVQVDLVVYLKEIYYSFYEYAEKHGVRYLFSAPDHPVYCWLDMQQIQKVIFNLLSNAFKYRHQHQQALIELVVEEKKDYIQIKIIDNGMGVSKEEIEKIFDLFYQSKYSDNTSFSGSSGIGLSLAKKIVDMHRGNIQVESKPGYGTIFIVTLQKGKSHFREEEFSIISNSPLFHEPEDSLLPEKEDSVLTPEPSAPDPDPAHIKVLIIEDNKELLITISSIFSSFYQVINAPDGRKGLELARAEMPDLILSDIMMPEMSGTELCVKIKNDFDLCHIPVVLLTALGSLEHRLEGLNYGADDYISKPFNSKLLLAKCQALIRNRLLIKQRYSKEDVNISELGRNSIDKEFLHKVTAIIDTNLDNREFDLIMLSRELGISRSSVFTKFKGLTGMTPNDFILNYKMKKAAQMLKEFPEWQITDIAIKLGFSSAQYFTRCFKSQYHIPPNEYRRRVQK